MDEDSIRPEVARRDPARTRVVLLLLLLAVVAGGVLLLHQPKTATPEKFEVRGLKLVDTIVHLPGTSFRTVDLFLPCEGTLSIDVEVEGENVINVFLVSPDELSKMKSKQTFAHLNGFGADQLRKYQRSARLPPGKYCLVLLAPGPLLSPTARVQVGARLTDLSHAG